MIRFFLAFFALTATFATAAPVPYALEASGSTVGFIYTLGDDDVRGTMPVLTADLALDFDDVSKSQVNVKVDVTRTKAGFAFATKGIKGPELLHAAAHPQITFTSTAFRKIARGYAVDGRLTVRGVTKPVTLTGRLTRAPGTSKGDHSRLVVFLNGAISRSAFGADGYPKFVNDKIVLDIKAAMKRVD